ncbi:MAG TPA: allantoinase AllB, partial [Pyrinomonadaceae bacterium]|nr:allantoinase AllB [Pyrinomonadaceae bacterium]
SVHVRRGYISSISIFEDVPSGCDLIEAGEGSVVMPGLVDTHVHVNEPGRTDWEGFATATRAAAAGGVTTIVDMPLNSIPATTTLAGLKAKLEAASGKCSVDVAFWGGVVPGNTGELAELWEAGVVGFKCFLVHSGVDEFPNVTEKDLRAAMPELARLGATLIVHAELPGPIEAACGQVSNAEVVRTYDAFLRTRPRAAENEAVKLMIRLSRETECRVHIVHLSSAEALTTLREAKAAGVLITAETCPHYLYFGAEEIPDRATEFKCCPPIREHENREELWDALRDGTIDMVVSDHSPCPPEMKLPEPGDFTKAWGGISSLQLRLPVMWTEAKKRGFTISQIAEWLCRAPTKLVGLDRRKGAIAVGYDADIVIWNPDAEFRVAPEMIHHRHKLTPYAGEVLLGKVEKTFLRGQMVYDCGDFSERKGTPLLRTSS